MLSFEEFKIIRLQEIEQETLLQNQYFNPADMIDDIKKEYNIYISGILGQKFFLEETELTKVQAKATETEATWKQDWLKLFGAHSFNNELAAEALFYVFISLMTKNKEVKFGLKKIRPALHLFWCQASGTGKDQAIDLLMHIINQVSKKGAVIAAYEMAGSESPETLLNHFETKGDKTMITKPVKGVFESFDLLNFREASYLFFETRSDRQSKSELLLQGLEGRAIEKTLISWNGQVTRTQPNFCFIGLTRPVALRNQMAYSGLLQRSLTYFRWVTTEDRGKMLESAGMNTFTKTVTPEDQTRIIGRIGDAARQIVMLAQSKEVVVEFEDPKALNQVMTENINKMLRENMVAIKKWELREILESFISRYRDLAINIAILDAYSKFKTKVGVAEIQTAFNMLWKVYDSVRIYIEHSVIEDSAMSERRRMVKEISEFVLKEGPIKYKEFVKCVSRRAGISESYAYCLVRKLMDDGFIDKDFDSFMHLTKK